MAFQPYSSGAGDDHGEIIELIMDNSITIAVGEAVKLNTTTGFVTNATAGAPLLGIVCGFKNSYGGDLPPTAYAAGTATSSDVTSVTTTSTNTTVLKYMAIVDASKIKKWSAQVNGTVGTTSASGVIGCGLDVDSAGSNYGRILETTGTRTAGTVTNFMGLGTDPNDSTRIIVKIASSVLDKNVS